METLGGFPNLPATVRPEPSSAAPDMGQRIAASALGQHLPVDLRICMVIMIISIT
jgi:hypothetical protein